MLGPRPGCPVVFQHNDLLPGALIGAAVRVAAARADGSVALSDAIAADLGRSRTAVVRPGVNVGRFDQSAPAASPPEVLMLGALTGWKRPDLALEAVALARRRTPSLDLRLRLVGAPLADDSMELVESLRTRAAQPDLAGAVELAGAVADPVAALGRASCLLHCAEREPFGMAVLEALAAGRPAIVPAAAGPLEIVDDRCGLTYRPGDPSDAADALIKVLADPARMQSMGAAGRERAEHMFTPERARREYLAAVEPMIRRRRPIPTQLSLVSVTRNSERELRALLASVERYLPGTEVLVIDCASSDGTLEVARSAPFVQTVALEENVGFGRGCNLGVRMAREPVVGLINPDVALVDGSLSILADVALRSERLLAPRVLYPDGSRQDSVHPVPGSRADLARSLLPPDLLPGRLGVALAPWQARAPRRVGWAIGAALVARTDTLRRLGPFDERIFMYGEDLDLGLRAAAAGVETWFWPSARVVHHRAHASSREFGGEPFETLARARHEVVARRLGDRAAALDDRAQALTFRSRGALKRALGRPAERERRQLEALSEVRRTTP
jgi:GT2 family glycosyltransferase